MVPFFPKQLSTKAITLYLVSLAIVSIIFVRLMMKFDFIIIGIMWVLVFFLLSARFTRKWVDLDEKHYCRKVFWTALWLRLAWVVFSFFFFTFKTGVPFEFGSSDALGYHNEALWFQEIGWKAARDYLSRRSLADAGYVTYLGLLYSVTGGSIIVTRIIKALLSSWMCLLIYKLAKRNMGEEVGRMAGIFCCLMPNLIMYCGLHLKETEMIFLCVATLERADSLLRSTKFNFWKLLVTVLLAVSLFFFRTVLGATTIFAILTGLVFSSSAVMSRWNKVVLISWAIIGLGVMAGGSIASEALSVWEGRNENQAAKRDYQVYGGNYVRNFLGIFVLIALFSSIFVLKNWRDLSMLWAFPVSYLGVVCMSGFSNSERFLLPGLPFLLMLSAYGVSLMNARNFRWVKVWYWVVPVMVIGWAVFKLGSRGLL